jgi:hypothetical protein
MNRHSKLKLEFNRDISVLFNNAKNKGRAMADPIFCFHKGKGHFYDWFSKGEGDSTTIFVIFFRGIPF